MLLNRVKIGEYSIFAHAKQSIIKQSTHDGAKHRPTLAALDLIPQHCRQPHYCYCSCGRLSQVAVASSPLIGLLPCPSLHSAAAVVACFHDRQLLRLACSSAHLAALGQHLTDVNWRCCDLCSTLTAPREELRHEQPQP